MNKTLKTLFSSKLRTYLFLCTANVVCCKWTFRPLGICEV